MDTRALIDELNKTLKNKKNPPIITPSSQRNLPSLPPRKVPPPPQRPVPPINTQPTFDIPPPTDLPPPLPVEFQIDIPIPTELPPPPLPFIDNEGALESPSQPTYLPPPPVVQIDIPMSTDLLPPPPRDNETVMPMPPPSDLPPLLLSAATLNHEGQKCLTELANKYIEFFKVGENLSSKASLLPDFLSALLSNLKKSIVYQLKDDGLSLALFTTKVMDSANKLATSEDPAQLKLSQKLKLNEMNILDISVIFSNLHRSITDPNYNEIFKQRAIQCVLLTFAYGKLQQSRELLINSDKRTVDETFNLLSAALQRISQIKLFAIDAQKVFLELDQHTHDHYSKEHIKQITALITDLVKRSVTLAKATDLIQSCIQLVSMDTMDNRFSDIALNQMNYFEGLVCWIVPKIMESPQPEFVYDELDIELKSNLPLKSAQLYRDVVKLISESKNDLDAISRFKEQLQNQLCNIHESPSKNDKSRLAFMKMLISNTNEMINIELKKLNSSYLIFTARSDFKNRLSKFIEADMEKYVAYEISHVSSRAAFSA